MAALSPPFSSFYVGAAQAVEVIHSEAGGEAVNMQQERGNPEEMVKSQQEQQVEEIQQGKETDGQHGSDGIYHSKEDVGKNEHLIYEKWIEWAKHKVLWEKHLIPEWLVEEVFVSTKDYHQYIPKYVSIRLFIGMGLIGLYFCVAGLLPTPLRCLFSLLVSFITAGKFALCGVSLFVAAWQPISYYVLERPARNIILPWEGMAILGAGASLLVPAFEPAVAPAISIGICSILLLVAICSYSFRVSQHTTSWLPQSALPFLALLALSMGVISMSSMESGYSPSAIYFCGLGWDEVSSKCRIGVHAKQLREQRKQGMLLLSKRTYNMILRKWAEEDERRIEKDDWETPIEESELGFGDVVEIVKMGLYLSTLVLGCILMVVRRLMLHHRLQEYRKEGKSPDLVVEDPVSILSVWLKEPITRSSAGIMVLGLYHIVGCLRSLSFGPLVVGSAVASLFAKVIGQWSEEAGRDAATIKLLIERGVVITDIHNLRMITSSVGSGLLSGYVLLVGLLGPLAAYQRGGIAMVIWSGWLPMLAAMCIQKWRTRMPGGTLPGFLVVAGLTVGDPLGVAFGMLALAIWFLKGVDFDGLFGQSLEAPHAEALVGNDMGVG